MVNYTFNFGGRYFLAKWLLYLFNRIFDIFGQRLFIFLTVFWLLLVNGYLSFQPYFGNS